MDPLKLFPGTEGGRGREGRDEGVKQINRSYRDLSSLNDFWGGYLFSLHSLIIFFCCLR
jgi:hypothetical protein